MEPSVFYSCLKNLPGNLIPLIAVFIKKYCTHTHYYTHKFVEYRLVYHNYTYLQQFMFEDCMITLREVTMTNLT